MKINDTETALSTLKLINKLNIELLSMYKFLEDSRFNAPINEVFAWEDRGEIITFRIGRYDEFDDAFVVWSESDSYFDKGYIQPIGVLELVVKYGIL